jgi:hypothetical protein
VSVKLSVEPWEPLLEDLTYITPSLRAQYPEYWAPMSVGVEIEFKASDARACPAVREAYKIKTEVGDTVETNLPPAIEYTPVLKEFVDTVLRCEGGKKFYWRKAGNHVHFRPREDIEAVKRNWLAAWKASFETVFTVSLLLLPALAFGEEFRPKLYSMAYIYEYWIPPVPVALVKQWLEYEGTEKSFRSYAWLTPNIDPDKPLTYELRANEGSPGQILLAVSVIQKAVKYAFEKRFTPVLFTNATYFRFLEAVYSEGRSRLDWKRVLRRVSPIEFRGFAGMPYMNSSYRDGVEAFIDLIWLYTPRTTHHMRVAAPLALGVPISRKLHEKYWHVFAPEGSFCWELPSGHKIETLCDRDIRDMFSSRETFMEYVKRYGEW